MHDHDPFLNYLFERARPRCEIGQVLPVRPSGILVRGFRLAVAQRRRR